jgi:energy-coupling factor transporter ATP-binding protein EcfA2
MFIEILSHAAVTSAFEAYAHSKEITQTWTKIKYYLRHGKLSVLVIGAGGVGKSTLTQFLSKPIDKVTPKKYDESLHIETVKFPGGVMAELIAAPGQSRHHAGWDELFDDLKKENRPFGIINVASYGYHSTNLDLKGFRLANESTAQATLRYLGECRNKELEIVSDLVSRLAKHKVPFWMLTLITKQDLWWAERKNVEKLYLEGGYDLAIKKIENGHSATGFRHEYFSVALHSQNFLDGAGSLIQATAQGYDDEVKFANQAKLLKIILGFVNPR